MLNGTAFDLANVNADRNWERALVENGSVWVGGYLLV